MRPVLLIIMLVLSSFFVKAQKITNVHFEQVGKKINIYYDMQGEDNYLIIVYCSEDGGSTWGNPLQMVIGAVGKNQTPGINKIIVWDVLEEWGEISGNIQFKIDAIPESIPEVEEIFIDERDGQRYKWIKIGTQIWMAENLNYETGNSWCYKNNTQNCKKYGRLYKWKAAKIACPPEWRLPTKKDWDKLITYLGGKKIAGRKLKSVREFNGSNESMFEALPSGTRGDLNVFGGLGKKTYFWSSTGSVAIAAWAYRLSYDKDKAGSDAFSKKYEFSVRCIKN